MAIGNGGDPAAHASLSGQETADGSGRAPSRYDPVVREHVAWAEEALRARGLT
ncbi:MAG: hypothetical protein IMZ55_10955 [Acidobacteria bacterium]|nr:hypothetical protein [Acidobacteriota bacterium]